MINDSDKVSEKTRERVLQVIEAMDYRPNVFAKGLTTQSMHTIGVLTTRNMGIYFSAAVQELLINAAKFSYDVLNASYTYSWSDPQ